MSSLPPASGPVRGQVLCRARSGTLLTFNIKGEKTFVGRDPGLGVSVPLDGISRRHARITFDGKNYWIEDLKSMNGTFLNGEPVQKDRLRHLDVITLGKKADLLFVLRSEERQVVKKRQGIVRAALAPVDAPDAVPHEVGVGEITLGRSAACNVQAESATVSKVHAQVRRTLDQLAVQDLGSSNGTFVNGNRVMSAELHDGDVLSLGGVENYRIVVELGEVTSASGAYSAAAPATPAPERPRFSNAWKTRFEWDPQELKEIAAAQAGIVKAPERTLMPKAGVKAPVPAAPKAAPASRPPLSAAPSPPATARPPAPPVSPASKPLPSGTPAAPAVARPTTVPPPVSQPSQPPRPAAPPAAAPPRPAAPPAPVPAVSRPAPSPPPPRLEPTVAQDVPSFAPAPAAAPTPKARILEVRLAGSGYNLAVMESGAHNLGRAKDAPLRVDHPTVSRKHARIILGDDRSVAYLQDAGGANGTILNGVALQELKPIQEGDRIRIGEVELVVTLRRG